MVKKRIETGIDKLVTLVNEKKKIEIVEAAKRLGVSKIVAQEWAGFLEEQGVLSIEYSLSKVYLVERKLNQKEQESKQKEYEAKKDAFVRKVETTIQILENESFDFEAMKKKFEELKKDIDSEVVRVKEDVDELRHYEDLKRNMDQEVVRQKLEYTKMFEDLHKQIQFEEKKYDKILDDIEKAKSKIAEEKLDIDYMEKKEENLKRRIDSLKEIIKSVDRDVDEEKETLDKDLSMLDGLRSEVEKLSREVTKKKKEDLAPILKNAKENERKIIGIQEEILKKIRDKREEIEKYKIEGIKVVEEFERFFRKKGDTDKLLLKLEKDKSQLEKEFHDLIKSAKVFQITTKASNASKYIEELQKKFDKLENKKDSFKRDIQELNKLVTRKKN